MADHSRSGIGVGGWAVAATSLAFEVYQFRQARTKVSAKVVVEPGQRGEDHVRWLCIVVVNDGTNDIHVTLDVPKDGNLACVAVDVAYVNVQGGPEPPRSNPGSEGPERRVSFKLVAE